MIIRTSIYVQAAPSLTWIMISAFSFITWRRRMNVLTSFISASHSLTWIMKFTFFLLRTFLFWNYNYWLHNYVFMIISTISLVFAKLTLGWVMKFAFCLLKVIKMIIWTSICSKFFTYLPLFWVMILALYLFIWS